MLTSPAVSGALLSEEKRHTAVIEGNDHRGTGGQAVGSINHPKLYDPAASASVKAAFYEIWKTLEAQHAFARKTHRRGVEGRRSSGGWWNSLLMA
jgi:hypothetical protein